MRKKIKTKDQTAKENANKPTQELLDFIKLFNLVPSDIGVNRVSDNRIELVFLVEGKLVNSYWQENFDSEWDNYYLGEYPKLRKYLSTIAKADGVEWMSAFGRFKMARDFITIFFQVAEKYRENLKQRKNPKSIYGYESVTPNIVVDAWIKEKEQMVKESFNVTYPAYDPTDESKLAIRDRLEVLSPARNRDLGRELLAFAISYVSLEIDDEHLTRISFSKFINAIEEIDLRRLKKCVICSKVFWAYKLNKKYCSKKCSNKYHEKPYPKDQQTKDKINERRRSNYAQKKHLKKLKEQRENGNL